MERLYYEDAYIKEFSARVLKIDENGVVLDKTAFFPEGGGQTSDVGTLSGKYVCAVNEINGVIYHKIKGDIPFVVGDSVEGAVDFHKRFSDMQNHTGEHIVSGIVHNRYGYENVGFHLNEKEVALDFSGVLTAKDIDEIEFLANKAVWQNIELNIFYPDEEERKHIDFRSKKEIKGKLRLVEIDGIDLCACCAPHVRRTGEIGVIKIVRSESHRGGTRIYILCGERALRDYSLKQRETRKTGELLKVPEYETSDAVGSLLKKKNELEYEIGRMNIKSAEKAAGAYEKSEIIVAVDSFTGQTLTYFANFIKEKATKLAAVFGKTGENEYQYMLIAEKEDIMPLVKEMNLYLSGRGGGKNGSARGSVNCTEKEIFEFFEKVKGDAVI